MRFPKTLPLLLLLLLALGITRAADLKLPLASGSTRFAVIGDNGTGKTPEYETAQQMTDCHKLFPFDFVIMLGDNLYGGETPEDFKKKFEYPYKPLLDADVKFYACLGNHDDTNQRFYKPFNMDGKRYYSFRRGDARFLALDSTYVSPDQLDWISKQLSGPERWKICFFHYPLYSHGRKHGSDTDLRAQLEPLFDSGSVSAVFSGHDHIYERLKPQRGIAYFVVGCSGQLRPHGLTPSPQTAIGFDRDRVFALCEIAGDQLFFQTVARSGETVDSGSIKRRQSR
jgi:hypothetical protein